MAKIFQSKKPRRRKVTPKPSGLGLPPAEHKKNEEEYARSAKAFFRGVEDDASGSRCELAFEKLLNGVSYAGMAEAEAKRAGKSGSEFAKQTFEAVKQFKLTCRVK